MVQITCGSRHTVALLRSGDVYTWGDKENGVCGHGDTDGHQYVPRLVVALRGKGVVDISACGFHTCALSCELSPSICSATLVFVQTFSVPAGLLHLPTAHCSGWRTVYVGRWEVW